MRVAIFIDGNNVFHTAKDLGVEVDYKRLLVMLCGQRELLRATFYTHTDESDRQRSFITWLNRNGFKVVQKSPRERNSGRRTDIVPEAVADMCMLAPHVDVIVLVSGDESFAYPVEAVAKHGVRVEVASFKNALSSRLADAADYVIDLDAELASFQKV